MNLTTGSTPVVSPKRDVNCLTEAEYQAYIDMASACDATLEGLEDAPWFTGIAKIVASFFPRLSEDDREVLTHGMAELHTFAVRSACGIESEITPFVRAEVLRVHRELASELVRDCRALGLPASTAAYLMKTVQANYSILEDVVR